MYTALIRLPEVAVFFFVHYITLPLFASIQGVSRLVDITAGGDFVGLYDQKSSFKLESDFGR